MNELTSYSAYFFLIIAVVVIVVVALVTWYFINRASVRANEQICLLEALLEQQKQQNTMLRRLINKIAGEESAAESIDNDKDVIRLIPER